MPLRHTQQLKFLINHRDFMQEQAQQIVDRIADNYIKLEQQKNLTFARKFAEGICKLILQEAGISDDARQKSEASQLNTLIESLTKKNLSIPDNHLKKISDDLRRIQTYGNIESHDNDEKITKDETEKVIDAANSIIRNVFDSKELFDLDLQLPETIYKKINNSAQTEENWRCDHIISLVYPNRVVNLINRGKGYQLFKIEDADNRTICLLFIGRNVSFKIIFVKLLTESLLRSISSLTFIFPREISKATRSPIKNRKQNIQNIAKEFLDGYSSVKTSFHFTEDYIWDKCLPNSAKQASSNEMLSDPYFIDQEIIIEETNSKILSLDFIDSIVTNSEEVKKPVYMVFGEGGVGKTTFCEESLKKISKHQLNGQKKKAIFLSSYDLPDNTTHIINKIKSIEELYELISKNSDDYIELKNLSLNISSGNILIIIDGLDEIISRLKEKFDLESFIKSASILNDTYGNCSIIITSRELGDNKFDMGDVATLWLKGFDDNLINKYIHKRFQEGTSKATNALRIVQEVSRSSTITPLITRLICDLADDHSRRSNQTSESKFLYQKEKLDNVLIQLMDREIEKQSLEIEVDDYFEILKEVVFEHQGHIPIKELNELIEFTIEYKSRASERAVASMQNFAFPVLFKRNYEGTHLSIKYDALIQIIKGRTISFYINNNTGEDNTNLLQVIASECYRGGSLVNEICRHKNSNTEFEKKIIRKFSGDLKKGKVNEKNINPRKIISSLTHIYWNKDKKDQKSPTESIKDLFLPEGQFIINGLSIFGDFPSIDFTDIEINNGYFNEYTNLSKSKIPEGKIIFTGCEFHEISRNGFGKTTLSKDNFGEGCIICHELQELIKSNSTDKEKKTDDVKKDLKIIFDVGFYKGSFIWKSEQVYKQEAKHIGLKMGLEKALNLLERENFLRKENSIGSTGAGYILIKDKEIIVRDFTRQRIISAEIADLIRKFQ